MNFLVRTKRNELMFKRRTKMTENSFKALALRFNSENYVEKLADMRLSVLLEHSPTDFKAYIYEPVLCLILQGGKETSYGDQTVVSHKGDVILISHHIPVVTRITQASHEEPYIALIMAIDLNLLRSLYSEVGELKPMNTSARSMVSAPAEGLWLDPFMRYCAMAERPLDLKVLGPAILREVHYRLLTSSIGGMLKNLMVLDSYASRIAKATERLRLDFRQPIKIAELAKEAAMSMTMLHVHFKDVTGTTPLQFQKDLRLAEAKRLILGGQKIAEAAFAVGYESPNQFSRDYSRKFGAAPSDMLKKAKT
jgi:AraC-like DNA-binding protein